MESQINRINNFLKKKHSSFAELEHTQKFHNFLKEWYADPRNWNNNKRRFRGYLPLRKQVKGRQWKRDRNQLFDLACDALDEAVKEQINMMFDKMANIKDVKIDERYTAN